MFRSRGLIFLMDMEEMEIYFSKTIIIISTSLQQVG